jgi:hypothetical protein
MYATHEITSAEEKSERKRQRRGKKKNGLVGGQLA